MSNYDRDAAELAWKMFKKTGSISYYMLYKQLSGRK
ncbi:MAG TPA: YqzL family protein [Candidatus Coproplasma excrementigallinarum]|uniref:YqzL family protein n=1 Tax=Candidatus Coproplasma excrementigallinarum TaxID=2840747 RepID=A0A9D1SJ40_9FIRM|nr:YqzL family protein [Candidatus Coproplasma excrementigallinarum]